MSRPVEAGSVDAARLEAAQQVVILVFPVDQRQAMFAKVVDSFMSNMVAGIMDAMPGSSEEISKDPELGKVFQDFISRQRDLTLRDLEETTPELVLAYTHAYARAFTVEELGALNQFLASEAGRKYVELGPSLLSDPEIGAWQRAITAKAQLRKDEELKKFMDELMPIIRSKGAKHHGS